eukprot:128963-Amphidinium_carterae.1
MGGGKEGLMSEHMSKYSFTCPLPLRDLQSVRRTATRPPQVCSCQSLIGGRGGDPPLRPRTR